MDQTELDLELVSARTGQPLGKPWGHLLDRCLLPPVARRVSNLRSSFVPLRYDGVA
jgi:hypothetical protein